MYHQTLEFLTKVLYARRIRHVEKVGHAATLAREGKLEEALAYLAEIERKTHPKVLSFHAFTRAQILDRLGRESEAESEMIRSAKLDPSNFRAHLEIAKMSGRRFHFKNARARFQGLLEVPDEAVAAESRAQLKALDDIASGKAAAELAKRAQKAARIKVPPDDIALGLPIDIERLDRFITADPSAAMEMIEELAVLLGQSASMAGGTWQVSLSLTHSFVSFPNAAPYYPFEAAAYRLTGGDISILKYPTSVSK